MKPVHFYAGQRHYIDHLLPIWSMLDPLERGQFFVSTKPLAVYARDHDVPAVVARSFPTQRATEICGREPLFVVAGWQDYRLTGRRRCVFVEHGAGQTYAGDPLTATNHGYAGGAGRQRVALFICPNQRTADANSGAYPGTPAVVCGSPKLDGFPSGPPPGEPTVAVSFHWNCPVSPEAGWAFTDYRDAVERLPADLGMPVIGHAHPRVWGPLHDWYQSVGIPPVGHFADVAATAAVFVADNTSCLYEFAALDRPVVLLNSPKYRRDVEHGLRFWAMADVGIQVDDGPSLADAIRRSLTDDPQAVRRREITAELYPHRGRAAARAVDAMRTFLP